MTLEEAVAIAERPLLYASGVREALWAAGFKSQAGPNGLTWIRAIAPGKRERKSTTDALLAIGWLEKEALDQLLELAGYAKLPVDTTVPPCVIAMLRRVLTDLLRFKVLGGMP